MKIEFEEKRAFFVLVHALKSDIFIWKGILAQASTLGVFFHGALQALGSHQPSIWEESEAFYDMRNKIVRRRPSWKLSGVVSKQRLRLRRLTLVKRMTTTFLKIAEPHKK